MILESHKVQFHVAELGFGPVWATPRLTMAHAAWRAWRTVNGPRNAALALFEFNLRPILRGLRLPVCSISRFGARSIKKKKPASPEGGDDAGPVTTETDCDYDRPEAQTGNVVAASQT